MTASQRLDPGGIGDECASRPAELSETRIKTQAERRAGRGPRTASPTSMTVVQPKQACGGTSLGRAGRRPRYAVCGPTGPSDDRTGPNRARGREVQWQSGGEV